MGLLFKGKSTALIMDAHINTAEAMEEAGKCVCNCLLLLLAVRLFQDIDRIAPSQHTIL